MRIMRFAGCLAAMAAACAVQAQAPAAAADQASAATAQAPARKALRVCHDPNNMPFSNAAGQGIENKLAELMGQSLGLPVTYYAFPQRMNFIRNTLRHKVPGQDYPCDIVMAIPVSDGPVAVTQPYYRSTYALVVPQGRGWDDVQSAADLAALPAERKQRLRIGLMDKTPVSAWLAKHGLVDQGVPLLLQNADPDAYPSRMLQDQLASGQVDMLMAWGPVAGHLAKNGALGPLKVIPMASEPGVTLDFAIAMGVRRGEPEWKNQVEQWLASHRPQIKAVLQDFGVPLLEDKP